MAILYGVGVGPGAPDLITLRALNLLQSVRHIYYFHAPECDSRALLTVKEHIPQSANLQGFAMPMHRDATLAKPAYDKAIKALSANLQQGDDALMLCEGDPLTYGSFNRILLAMGDDEAIEIVPGITASLASAAMVKTPLAMRNQSFAIIPAPLPDEALRIKIKACDGFALIKLGRHMGRIKRLLLDMGLGDKAFYLEEVGLENQRMLPLDQAPDDAPYFSLLLVKKD